MARWLVSIFTYNRPELLLNQVRSVEKFFPWGDRIVIDDGSKSPSQIEVLHSIASRTGWKVEIKNANRVMGHGGYPQNLRAMFHSALEGGYDYWLSIEDDQQFLWLKPDYPEYVAHLFKTCPDAIQLQPLFLRRIKQYQGEIEYIASANAYRTNRGSSPIGIWNLNRIRGHADADFIADPAFERLNSAFWLKRGLRLYYDVEPTLAVVPWVSSLTGDDSSGSGPLETNDSRFLIPPLTDSEIQLLRRRDPLIPPVQELLDSSDNRPIWHQKNQNMQRYYSLCHDAILREKRGESPVRVEKLDQWQASSSTGALSHISVPVQRKSSLLEIIARALLPRWVGRMIVHRLPRRPSHFFSFLRLTDKIKRERMTYNAGGFSVTQKEI